MAAVLLAQDGRSLCVTDGREPPGRSAPRAPPCGRAHAYARRPARWRRRAVGPLARGRAHARDRPPSPRHRADRPCPRTSPRRERHDRPPLRGRLGEPTGRGFRRGANRRAKRTQQTRGGGVEHDDIAVGESEGPDLARRESYVSAHEGRVTRGRTSERGDRSDGPRRQPATRSSPDQSWASVLLKPTALDPRSGPADEDQPSIPVLLVPMSWEIPRPAVYL